jgi:hypothetical protein
MKKILVIVLFFVATTSFAQGNLQFNQVLTYSGTALNSPVWTVPTGKVWKVEMAYPFNYGGTSTFKVNNTIVCYNAVNTQPIWLKASDYCSFSVTTGGNSWFVSIIEFNIIP